MMAYKNKMDIAVEIAVGSTLQVAMFVAPLLVLISLLFPTAYATGLYLTRTDFNGNSCISYCYYFQ